MRLKAGDSALERQKHSSQEASSSATVRDASIAFFSLPFSCTAKGQRTGLNNLIRRSPSLLAQRHHHRNKSSMSSAIQDDHTEWKLLPLPRPHHPPPLSLPLTWLTKDQITGSGPPLFPQLLVCFHLFQRSTSNGHWTLGRDSCMNWGRKEAKEWRVRPCPALHYRYDCIQDMRGEGLWYLGDKWLA